ncbi:MAG: nitroreductase family protein [Endozoicomonas sp.]
MDFVEGLIGRLSCPILSEPAPTEAQLDLIFQAALRAPDHARLRPWRFLTISGDARKALGEVFAAAALKDQPDLAPEAIDRFRGLPLRAPMLVALVCNVTEHPKVPLLEQQLSVAAAAQNILNCAYAQGVGAMWRTGTVSYHPATARGLGLSDDEQLLGFIYLGTPSRAQKQLPALRTGDYVRSWAGS